MTSKLWRQMSFLQLEFWHRNLRVWAVNLKSLSEAIKKASSNIKVVFKGQIRN